LGGDAEVDNAQVALGVQHEVLHMKVAMKDTSFVHVVERQ
jgi:hypothetical protein